MGVAQHGLEHLAVALAPPGAATDRVAVRRVETRNARRGADLVEEDGTGADLLEDAASEALHHALPGALRGAHDGEGRRPRRVFLHVARTVLAHHGGRLGGDVAQSVGAPEAAVGVRHRLLPSGKAVRDRFLGAGLLREILRVVDVVAGMLPEMPVDAGAKLRKNLPGAEKNAAEVVGRSVEVDPKRNLACAAREVVALADRPLRAHGLAKGESAVAAGRFPPVAAQGRERHRMARPLGGLVRDAGVFDRRHEPEALAALDDHALEARFGVLGGHVESGPADEKRRDHWIIAEIVETLRLGPRAPRAEKAGAEVAAREHRVALAVAQDAAEAREGGFEERPDGRAVVERKPPALRAVGQSLDLDHRAENAALATKRNVAPAQAQKPPLVLALERRGVAGAHFNAIRRIAGGGELGRPQVAAAGGELRPAGDDRLHLVAGGEVYAQSRVPFGGNAGSRLVFHGVVPKAGNHHTNHHAPVQSRRARSFAKLAESFFAEVAFREARDVA